MRKFILICLSTVLIFLMLFPNGNYETVAIINIGDGSDDFLIKRVAESGEYPIHTYITPNNEFCILFPNNRLIRKYSPDFSSYETIPVSDSLVKKYSNKGDVEFIEAFMVGENNDVWYYFWSYKPNGSAVIHQLSNQNIDIFHISDACLDVASFIFYNNEEYLYGDWFFNKSILHTAVCLHDLEFSDNFIDLVNMRTDSVWLGINTPILKNDIKIFQYNHTLIRSGKINDTINLMSDGPRMFENPDYDIYHWPELDKDGNIVTLLRVDNKIHVMKRFLM